MSFLFEFLNTGAWSLISFPCLFSADHINITLGNVDKILVNEATSYTSVLVLWISCHKSGIQTTSDK
jgi:hypothetical protein